MPKSLLVTMIVVLAFTSNVIAQAELNQRDLVLPTPGEPKSFSSSDTATIDSSSTDVGSTIAGGVAFLKEYAARTKLRAGGPRCAI